MIIDYADALAKSDPVALARIMPTLRRCARAGATKVGGEHLADDVTQELTLLVTTKLAAKYNPEYQIEPILIESARRITLGILTANRELLRESVASVEDPDSYNDDLVGHEFDPHDVSVAAVDQANALDFLKAQMEKNMGFIPGITIDPKGTQRAQPTARLGTDPKRTKEKTKKLMAPKEGLTADHIEIRTIRQAINKSQAEFALALGVSAALIAAYEYGRTRSVQEEVLKKARGLLKSNGETLALRERFDHMKMSDILVMWAKRMMADPTDIKTIAKHLELQISTVSRWSKNEQRPMLEKMRVYDERATKKAKELRQENSAEIRKAKRIAAKLAV